MDTTTVIPVLWVGGICDGCRLRIMCGDHLGFWVWVDGICDGWYGGMLVDWVLGWPLAGGVVGVGGKALNAKHNAHGMETQHKRNRRCMYAQCEQNWYFILAATVSR